MITDFTKPDRRCWRYRLDENGALDARIFAQPDIVPDGEGWADSPADAAPASKAAEPEVVKAKPGRKPRAPVMPPEDQAL